MGLLMATRKKVRKTHATKTANKKKLKKHIRAVKIQQKKQISRGNDKESYRNMPIPQESSPMTYEEIVVKNIVANSKGSNVPDEAILTTSTLSSLSAGMKELSYRHGISVGRALYKVKSETKSYMFAYESVSDLVEFFQAAGHRHVTYQAFPDSIMIKIHDMHGAQVGTPIHAFEAGIISGFLSSAERRYVNVNESTCVNDAGSYCKFSIHYGQGEPSYQGGSTDSLNKLADHIAESATGSKKGDPRCIKSSYYMLESTLLYDKTYIESIKSIAGYMGKSVGDKLSLNGRAKASTIQRAIRLLNFGSPTILASKPLHMRLYFDRANSRRGLVDVSLAFINGLLSNNLHKMRLRWNTAQTAHTWST